MDTNWIAMIRLADGTEIPCTVKNVSKSGARLGVPGHCPLPDCFRFKVLGRDFVCSVRMAWRRGDSVGVMIEQVGKLRPPAAAGKPPAGRRPSEPSRALQARRSRFSDY